MNSRQSYKIRWGSKSNKSSVRLLSSSLGLNYSIASTLFHVALLVPQHQSWMAMGLRKIHKSKFLLATNRNIYKIHIHIHIQIQIQQKIQTLSSRRHQQSFLREWIQNYYWSYPSLRSALRPSARVVHGFGPTDMKNYKRSTLSRLQREWHSKRILIWPTRSSHRQKPSAL